MVSHYVHARAGRLIPAGLLSLAAATALLLTLMTRTAAGTRTRAVLFADVTDGPSLAVGGYESLIGLAERLTLWSFVAWLAVTAAGLRRRPVGAHAGR